MADIRINALATTAASTASDDFVAVDGSANGTRKLNAYSPTFGGNLTVSGTGTSSVAGSLQANGGTAQSVNTPALRIGNDKILVWLDSSSTTTNAGFLWYDSSNILRIGAENGTRIQVSAATTTISNNLTVSGTGTSALTSSSSKLVVGSTTATSTNAIGVPQITAESDIYSSIGSIAHNDTNGNHGFLALGKSRGTKASPTILADGDVFGELSFVAYDGAAYRTSGQIRSVIAGTPGASDLPTALDFRVAPDASATPATAMRIAPNGNLLIGTTTDGGQKLQVAGTAYIGSATTSTNILTVQGNGPNTTHQAGTATAALWNRWLNSAGTRRGYYGYASAGDSTFTIMNEESGSFVLGTNNTTALTLDSSQNATFAGKVATGGAAAIGVAVSTGLGLNVNLNPGTLTYGAADAWLGARIRPARSGTTGNAFAISGQLEVNSGTQTKAATIMAEAPSGTITNHTYFYANSSGSRVAPTGNYSLYAESTAGPAYIGDATASTSTTTGALQVAGGVGVAGAVNVGGAIAIGNTVQTAAGVSSTHKVTISIGGSTYYLLATNV